MSSGGGSVSDCILHVLLTAWQSHVRPLGSHMLLVAMWRDLICVFLNRGESTGLLSKFEHSFPALKNDQVQSLLYVATKHCAPQIQVVRVSDGHHLHLHHPEEVQQLVNTFLLHQTIPSHFEVSKL